MQELAADKDFFDWLRIVARAYGHAMSSWGQHVHELAAKSSPEALQTLIAETDATIEGLVGLLVNIGRRHEDPKTPGDGHAVLDALDRLLAASADLLRDARTGIEQRGVGALAALAPRIDGLRALEAEVERASLRLSGQVTDVFGEPDGR